jgi:hypothetical protein
MDSLPYLKKPKGPQRATVLQLGLTKPLLSKLKLLKILLLALSFSFSQYLGLCVVFFYFITSN